MRLDQFLVQYKNIESRTKAQQLIEAKLVQLISLHGQTQILSKSNFQVSDSEIEFYLKNIVIINNQLQQYVSRAGHKLAGALEHIQLHVEGFKVLDVGQSTGGFTDCLLQKNVQLVAGIDVGIDQLHEKIKKDARVYAFEKVNAKDLSKHSEFNKAFKVGEFDLVVCDVSFISITKITEAIKPYLKKGGYLLFLVKPQFECGPQALDKNGIIKDENFYAELQDKIMAHFKNVFQIDFLFFESSITGKEGNKEFFIYGQT